MDKTELRLTLLENGYTPIPILDKVHSFRGWPKLQPTEALIRGEWDRSLYESTALLVRDDLAVIDSDITDKAIMDEIATRFMDYLELDEPVVRLGSSCKEAWFVRTSEPFARLASRVWHPADDPERGLQCEIYSSGGHGRYFGAFGTHTPAEGDKPAILYRWPGASPLTVAREDLPVYSKEQLLRLVDIVDEVFEAAGWEFDKASKTGEYGGEHLYDLDYDMFFHMDDGTRATLEDLEKMAEDDPHLDRRCSASFLGDKSAKSMRARIHSDSNRRPIIHVYGPGTTHHPAEDKPDFAAKWQETIDKLTARPAIAKHRPRPGPYDDLPRPTKGDSLETAADKMVKSYAFVGGGDAGAIYMGAASLSETMSMGALRDKMAPYADERPATTPTGRPTMKKINPADMWRSNPDRIDVDGIVSAPGRPTPTFTYDGRVFVNSYRPPRHEETGGSSALGWALIKHLFRIPAEHDYFCKLLAHKIQHPETPGPSVIMVADNTFGTGRTTLGQVIEHLFGARYVKELEFRTLSGETSQSQYNEWAATAVVVLVDESSETQGAQYKQKRNAYEFLKRHCDPRRVKRQITIKGKNNYQAETCATFFIATNHIDAISIPENDRRFAVLSNGEKLPADLAKAVNEWMLDPANIAAFYRDLMSFDVADYDPYAEPIKTSAKTRMATETMSDLEQAVALAMLELQSPVITIPILTKMVEAAAKEHSLHLPGLGGTEREAFIKKIAKRKLHAVFDGTRHMRVQINKERQLVYATSDADARRYGNMDAAFVTRDVKKNQDTSTPTGIEKLAEVHNMKGDQST